MNIDFSSEKIIEDFIYEKIKQDHKCPVTKDVCDEVYRQFNLGRYGIADIVKVVCEFSSIIITVVEIKNTPLKAGHVEQLCRYMTAFEHFFEDTDIDAVVVGELFGTGEGGDVVFLLDQLPRISAFTMSCDFESGFSSNSLGRGWNIPNESFDGLNGFKGKLHDLIEINSKPEIMTDSEVKSNG